MENWVQSPSELFEAFDVYKQYFFSTILKIKTFIQNRISCELLRSVYLVIGLISKPLPRQITHIGELFESIGLDLDVSCSDLGDL